MKQKAIMILLLYFNYMFCNPLLYQEGAKDVLIFGQYSFGEVHKAIDYFSSIAIELPIYLNFACEKKLPCIFFCPQNYSDVSTVGDQAYIIEGARTALAWLSAYYRFKQLNFLVVLVPNDMTINDELYRQYVEPALNYLLNLKELNDIKAKIITLDALKGKYSLGTFETITLEKKYAITPITITNHSKKTCLIAGGAGFLGSHLSEALLEQGCHVIVLDNLICANAQNIKFLKKYESFEFINVDINEPLTVDGHIDVIIHLASIPSPVYYYKMPFETLPCGLIGTKNLLDLARDKKAIFIFASSSEVYGDPTKNPQSEDYVGNVDPLGMRSQYDQSKRGGETLCKWYFENYGVDVRILRIFNTYGPRMNLHDGRVITSFVDSLLNKRPLIIHGTGNQTRSLSFVDDTIQGLLKIMDLHLLPIHNIQERIFNIGNDQEYTINQVAHIAQEIGKKYLDYEVSIKHIPQLDPTDPRVRRPDLSKIKKLGHLARINLREGFERTFVHFQLGQK